MGQFTNFSDNFSPGNKLAVAIVVCAGHGCARTTSAWAIAHVSYRYFIFEASVLGRFLFNHTIHKFPTSIILLPITKRAYFCLFLYHHFIIIWVSFILFLWKGKAIEWQKLPALKDRIVSHYSNNKSTVVSHMKIVFVVPNFTKSLIRLVSHFIPSVVDLKSVLTQEKTGAYSNKVLRY